MGRKAEITSIRRIERERRTAAILQMRCEGHSLRAIGEAQRPPVSGVAIFKTIRRALERMASEAVEQVRKLEAMRLDEMSVGVYPQAITGDISAIDTVLAIMARRARLLGLDVRPAHVDGAGGEFDRDRPPAVMVEIVGERERARRIAALESALEGLRDGATRVTSLN